MSSLPLARRQASLTHWSLRIHPANPEPVPHPSIVVVVTDHVNWARMIARGVRQAFQFVPRSQEEQDLEATAFLAIVELAQRFDPTKVPPGGDPIGAFRGWAAIDVRCRCQREARRLRNGGTYNTRREKAGKALVVERLRDESELIDPRSLIERDEPDDEFNP
ncbi:MAG TPA: hypothetical protein VG122_11965 [Gemmata sp.]|nr:hypothetical protein [Gemmata sp.]